MPNNGARFKNAIIREIESWHNDISILSEKPVGYRFVNSARTLDIILRHENKYLGIEAKIQQTEGTAYQKLSYTLDDCISAPIPTIIVFSGDGIKQDMKSKLITSGIGLEVGFVEDADPINDRITDPNNLFRQRVYIELGLDWFALFQ